jgi:breast cancer 2 susceptibility protein
VLVRSDPTAPLSVRIFAAHLNHHAYSILLTARYERELNGGSRPPLRKIVNQDAPAAFPMVLCVSNILWPPPDDNEDGVPTIPHPELELTDGWYRIRAQVDLPMARAVKRGVIKVGRKIGIAGARVSRFDLCEDQLR